MVSTILAVNINALLKAIERATGLKLPSKVIEISLSDGVLHIRFEHPEGSETEVEPLPTRTPIYLFRDDKTGRVTALEIVDVDGILKELGLEG